MKEAVDVCLEHSEWQVALQLTDTHQPTSDGDAPSSDTVSMPAIRRRLAVQLRSSVHRLLDQSRPIEAVELLKRAGHYLDAAKLMLRVGMRTWQNNQFSPTNKTVVI